MDEITYTYYYMNMSITSNMYKHMFDGLYQDGSSITQVVLLHWILDQIMRWNKWASLIVLTLEILV